MTTEKPLISFILPNYNNQHVLDLFFEKFVINNTYENYEFIVCDDGSEDDGLELLYKWQNSGKINNMQIIAEPHKGIINALNKCLYAAKGNFIIRCDGDATIETKSFVEKFLDFYYINPEKIGVITSKVLIDDGNLHAIGRSVISPTGLVDRGKEPTEQIGKRKWDDKTKPIKDLAKIIDEVAECDMALGVLTFCDRETALKIGGFDENYPLWIEDDDFYLSFRLYGKKCFYLPDIEVCHRFSMRGDRNPANWSRNKNKFSWLFNKKTKSGKTKYHLLGVQVFKKKETNVRKKYYVFGIQVFTRKYQSWRSKILQHDYSYWKQKWGFDILNPNMNDIKEKYKGTEILWNYDEDSRKLGQNIIQQYKNLKQEFVQTNLTNDRKIILIGEGCWFIDSFKYFIERGFSLKVILTKEILWTANLGILKSIGAELIYWNDSENFIKSLGLNKNTIVLGGGNFGGDVNSFKNNEKLKEKGLIELDVLYKISRANIENQFGAKVIRYFNGDTGFASSKMIEIFDEKIKYCDILMFDNSAVKDFVLSNIPNALNKKHLFGWIETPLEKFVHNNKSLKFEKSYISMGRIICSTPLDYKKMNTLFYPFVSNVKIQRFFHKRIKGRKNVYYLAGSNSLSNILNDRHEFYLKHNAVCFGLSHFYDIFDNSVEKFEKNKQYYFSLEGQQAYCNKNSSKELYYAFINNPNKDVCYLMNGIIPLISHTEHNLYKELINKKMAILIKDKDDLLKIKKMSKEEIQNYRNNIFNNRHLFTFDHVGQILIDLVNKNKGDDICTRS